MKTTAYDIQIRLNPIQSQILTEIAYIERRTVFELVGQILEEAINQKKKILSDKRVNSLKLIKKHRAKILLERGGKPLNIDLSSLIQEIRNERDKQLFGNFTDYRD